jgi:hypothetical protein
MDMSFSSSSKKTCLFEQAPNGHVFLSMPVKVMTFLAYTKWTCLFRAARKRHGHLVQASLLEKYMSIWCMLKKSWFCKAANREHR